MRILVTGRGAAQSWTVRGEQIGAALGATVKPQATLADMRAADVVLVVKRCPPDILANLRASGRPFVYDILDAYPQPTCYAWTRREAITWIREHVAKLQPAAVIWPTRRMRDDADLPGEIVYHHARPGIEPNPIRERIETIGYEGSIRYLDGWNDAIAAECKRRGLRWVINPPRLADVDVVIAIRRGIWDSYATRNFKSQIKLANAHAAGVPFAGQREAGYLETSIGGEQWIETMDDLRYALDWLAPHAVRAGISERFKRAAISVDVAAAQVRAVLEAVAR
jgi:hypothetical protein